MSLRPIGLLIVAPIEILLGVFYGYFGLSEVVEDVGSSSPEILVLGGVHVFLSIALLFGGVGLFMVKRWGRTLNLVMAILFILYTMFSLAGILVFEPPVYIRGIAPLLLIKALLLCLSVAILYYLTRPSVRAAFGILMVIFLFTACTRVKEQAVRPPAVAGSFYPADPDELRKTIQGFLSAAKKPEPQGDLVALLAPHAGYVYSGLVAAHSYKMLEGTNWDTIVIIGASHRPSPSVMEGWFAIVPEGSFETPLGMVGIESRIVRDILKGGARFTADSASHFMEHSIEVQLPFLQVLLRGFKLVPILVGRAEYSDIEEGARVIARALKGKRALLIASSDLSHYPADDAARKADAGVLDALGSLDPARFRERCSLTVKKGIPGLEVAVCGEDAILLTLLTSIALGSNRASLLFYANSHDAGGAPESVVGYGAMAFYRGRPARQDREGALEPISPKGQKKLLSIARETIRFFLTNKKLTALKEIEEGELMRPLGVFVTLRKAGSLRGCIGNIVGGQPLYESVREMAVAAATQDPRFPPVTASDLKDISIEISVLSPIRRISDVKEIVLGKHGVIIRKGAQSGLFLPQVADETGWGLQRFLNEICTQKAGLSTECWKDKEAEVSVFTVQVFEESQK